MVQMSRFIGKFWLEMGVLLGRVAGDIREVCTKFRADDEPHEF